jgi:hypothetical protein
VAVAPPTFYDLLDVAPDATSAEIRRAYLDLARAHHPDQHAAAGDAARTANEREMQRINEAWAVLGDAGRRRAYDATLARTAAPEPSQPTVTRRPADYSFTPIDDDDDTDYAELLDDTPVAGTEVSRTLQVLPVAAVLAGIALVVLGSVVHLTFLLALGLVGLAVGGLAFVATPVVAVMRSYQADRDR